MELILKDFLNSYSSSLSNYQIKNIKKEFIKWIEILKQNDLIENNYEIIQNGQYHRTYQLTQFPILQTKLHNKNNSY